MDTLGVMHTFGWTSEKVMQGYTQLSTAATRESYVRAMEKSAQNDEALTESSASIEAYFAGVEPKS
jgi:hypothetical protein